MTTTPASDEQSITIVRTIAAPVAEVFAAWTEPSLMRRWLAPIFCKVVEASADPRPGGRYRIVLAGPFGGRHVTSGEYRDVVPNELLVQTWVVEGQSPGVDPYETLLSVHFREIGPAATEITLCHERLRTRADRSGNRMGWRLCLNKLEALLERRGSSRNRD